MFWKKVLVSGMLFAISAMLTSLTLTSMVEKSCAVQPTLNSQVVAGGRMVNCVSPPFSLVLALFVLTFVPVVATVYLFTHKDGLHARAGGGFRR